MIVTLFIVLFAGSVALLMSGIKYKRYVLTIAATAMSLVCALQAHTIEIVSGNLIIPIRSVVPVFASWIITAAGITASVFGVVGALNSRTSGGAG